MKKKRILSACLCAVMVLAMTVQPAFAATAKTTAKKPASTAPILTAAQTAEKTRLNNIIKSQAENAKLEQALYESIGGEPTVKLNVKNVLQKPELPNGCEATAFTMLINYEGINLDKVSINTFLPKKGFSKVNGNSFRAGGDPENFFCGDPDRITDAFYCFEGAVLSTIKNISTEFGVDIKAKKLDKATESDLTSLLDQGTPVMVWGTLSMGDPVSFPPSGWVDLDTGRFVDPYLNLHSVVLTGYNSDFFFVSDPLRGDVAYKRSTLMSAYEKMGSRAIIIEDIL